MNNKTISLLEKVDFSRIKNNVEFRSFIKQSRLILVMGFECSGKTTLSKFISKEYGFKHLCVDTILADFQLNNEDAARLQRLMRLKTKTQNASKKQNAAAMDVINKEFCMDDLYQKCAKMSANGSRMVLEGTFLNSVTREYELSKLAKNNLTDISLIYLTAPFELRLKRLIERAGMKNEECDKDATREQMKNREKDLVEPNQKENFQRIIRIDNLGNVEWILK